LRIYNKTPINNAIGLQEQNGLNNFMLIVVVRYLKTVSFQLVITSNAMDKHNELLTVIDKHLFNGANLSYSKTSQTKRRMKTEKRFDKTSSLFNLSGAVLMGINFNLLSVHLHSQLTYLLSVDRCATSFHTTRKSNLT
jgi:hypothetical protein